MGSIIRKTIRGTGGRVEKPKDRRGGPQRTIRDQDKRGGHPEKCSCSSQGGEKYFLGRSAGETARILRQRKSA